MGCSWSANQRRPYSAKEIVDDFLDKETRRLQLLQMYLLPTENWSLQDIFYDGMFCVGIAAATMNCFKDSLYNFASVTQWLLLQDRRNHVEMHSDLTNKEPCFCMLFILMAAWIIHVKIWFHSYSTCQQYLEGYSFYLNLDQQTEETVEILKSNKSFIPFNKGL